MDPNAPVEFKSMQEGIQNALLSTVKTTNRITTHDLAFQRTANPSTADLLDDKIEHVLSTSNDLLGSAAKACGVAAPKLEDAEDIDFNWRKIIDVVDSLLEKAATALDEYTGAVKRRDAPSAETVRAQPPFGRFIALTVYRLRRPRSTKARGSIETYGTQTYQSRSSSSSDLPITSRPARGARS